jgi:adenosylhomocysteine nucleosidase
MNILIVTPLQQECDFFLQGCRQAGLQTEEDQIGRLPAVRLPELKATVACGGLGKAQFAAQTQHLLDMRPGWELVICAGAAGGLADEVAVGDVVVGVTTVEHDYKNGFSTRPRPRFEGAAAAVEGLRRLSLVSNGFNLHFGVIASGDEDIVDDERRRILRETTQAVAVAWEGAGGARACAFSQVPYLELRGITDAANHEAPASFKSNLELAMVNMATVVVARFLPPLGNFT